jgi:hypothetical protein
MKLNRQEQSIRGLETVQIGEILLKAGEDSGYLDFEFTDDEVRSLQSRFPRKSIFQIAVAMKEEARIVRERRTGR